MDSRVPPHTSMMAGPTSYAPTNSSSMISPNPSSSMMPPGPARFPFASSEPFAAAQHDGPTSPSALAKKKRGRPRKYSPDGNIALGLAPTHASPSSAPAAGDSGASDAPPKKHRGRPPGSGKKQLDALGTCYLSLPASD